MRILIIESQPSAALHLIKLLKELTPEKNVVGHCKSLKDAAAWLHDHPLPDLIFSVVELPDGLVFDLLRRLKKNPPVIFTCDYEKYAIDSFKVNSIDFLLKPVRKEDLREALKRYENYFSKYIAPEEKTAHTTYQERFIVNLGRQMKLIQAVEIAYFYTENKMVYLVSAAGDKYTIDFTLEQLEKLLDPRHFFRINRQFIVNISSIIKMSPASKSRLSITLRPETKHETITSNERTAGFRKWLTGLQ